MWTCQKKTTTRLLKQYFVYNMLHILAQRGIIRLYIYTHIHTVVGSRFMTGLRSQIFGCKSNCRKTSTIYVVYIEIGSWDKQISLIIL